MFYWIAATFVLISQVVQLKKVFPVCVESLYLVALLQLSTSFIFAIQVSCHFISTGMILSNYRQETGGFDFQDFIMTNSICNRCLNFLLCLLIFIACLFNHLISSLHTSLRILALEKLGAIFNQVAFPLQYTPRKFVIHPEMNNLIEMDHNAYTEATKAQRKQHMAEVSEPGLHRALLRNNALVVFISPGFFFLISLSLSVIHSFSQSNYWLRQNFITFLSEVVCHVHFVAASSHRMFARVIPLFTSHKSDKHCEISHGYCGGPLKINHIDAVLSTVECI